MPVRTEIEDGIFCTLRFPIFYTSQTGGVKKPRSQKRSSTAKKINKALCPCLEALLPHGPDAKFPMPSSDPAALRVKNVRRDLVSENREQLLADYSAEEEEQRLELNLDESNYAQKKPVNYSKLLACVEIDIGR